MLTQGWVARSCPGHDPAALHRILLPHHSKVENPSSQWPGFQGEGHDDQGRPRVGRTEIDFNEAELTKLYKLVIAFKAEISAKKKPV